MLSSSSCGLTAKFVYYSKQLHIFWFWENGTYLEKVT